MAAKTTKTEAQRHSDFVETAKLRTSRALRAMKGVAATASKRYHSTAEERQQIVAALVDGVNRVRAAYDGKVETKGEFEFKS